MATRYQGDPFWLTAKFASTGRCGHEIKRGDRIFYYPKGKAAYCPQCSEARAADFNSAAADEDFYMSQY
jgi:hypothetical protein